MNLIRSALLTLSAATLLPAAASAITAGAFGPNGEGGTLNGQLFTVGQGGVVYELDAFVNIDGQDLNGAGYGTSAQLSQNPLPAGLDYSFSSALSADTTDIVLSYEFTNNTGADIANITFISFLDAEIDVPINTFFNELATTNGALDGNQGFEADEPSFVFGDIYFNALDGTLDEMNEFPPPEDVSMALSFTLDLLGVGDTWVSQIMISEDGDIILPGAFSMTQCDSDPNSTTEITYSALTGPVQVIPEPSAALVFAAGMLLVGGTLRGRRG